VLYERFYAWYSKNYRALILIPVIVFLSAMFIFYNNWQATGEFFPKDIDLSGGTVVSVYTSVVPEGVKEEFESRGFSFREIHSYETGELVAVSIEAGPGFSPQEVALLVNSSFPGKEYDMKSVGPAMGERFMRGAARSVVWAFLLMGVILALIFRQPIVAFTVILSGFLNVFEAAAYMTLLGVKLAPHTIGALLMLMGWSVDSEVLFDTKILREIEGDPKRRAVGAMKTAMTMSMSIFASLSALYFISASPLIKEMVIVLLLGSFFDIINTWFQSLSMVLWYTEGRK